MPGPMDIGSNADASTYGSDTVGVEDIDVSSQSDGAPELDIDVDEGEPTANEPQDDFDPEKWALKFRNSVIKPKNRQEAIQLMQKGYLFNKKDADLSARLKEAEAMKAELGDLMEVKQLWDSDEAFRQRILGLMQGADHAQQSVQDAADPNSDTTQQEANAEVQTLRQQLEELKEWKGQLEAKEQTAEQEKADNELKEEIDKLRADHSEQDWDTPDEDGKTLAKAIIQHALDNGIYSLEAAFRDLMWDNVKTNTEAETRKKVAEEKRKAAEAGIVSGESTTPVQNENAPDVRSMNWNQAADAALKDLGG